VKLLWLVLPLVALGIAACGTAAEPTPVPAIGPTPLSVPTPTPGPTITSHEAIGLVKQYLQKKTFYSTFSERMRTCDLLFGSALEKPPAFDAIYQDYRKAWAVSVQGEGRSGSWTVYERTGAIVANKLPC